jgi:hypothetical protein
VCRVGRAFTVPLLAVLGKFGGMTTSTPAARPLDRGSATAPLRPSLDREPAPAQDDSRSASDPEADPTRRAGPGARSGVTGEAEEGAGPGRTPAAPAEVALIVAMRRDQCTRLPDWAAWRQCP